MTEKENPAACGVSAKADITNIPLAEPAVNTLKQDNLVFFHTTFSALTAEEYKSAMSAIVQYMVSGTIPDTTGYMSVIIALAVDRIESPSRAPRKRGGQSGNQNAAKKREAVIESAAENESKPIEND